MAELGVNIDHVATVRQARLTYEPDPVAAAVLAELGGADGITVHLREDRRHIQDRDVRILKETVTTRLNLELSTADEIVGIATSIRPHHATLVPERRAEVTTEGGLDVVGSRSAVAKAIDKLREAGILVSLFLDPDAVQIDMAKRLGADAVELHTGQYALSRDREREKQLQALVDAGRMVIEFGMVLHAGHGLNYHNVQAVANISGMTELNIGHSIVSRAVLVGFERAVREMKSLVASH